MVRVGTAGKLLAAMIVFLPGMVLLDQIDPLEQIRNYHRFFDVPVIFMLADFSDEQVYGAYKAGADMCLPLPADLNDPYGFLGL